MSDDIPDFITQVRNPNEPPAVVATTTSVHQEPPPEKKPAPKKSCFASFFCCASQAEEEDEKAAPATAAPVRPVKISISQGGSTGQIPANPAAPGNGEDYGINSPRASGKYNTQGVAVYSDDHLLPPQSEKKKGKKCLVLDLDETLVHSSFKLVHCDFVVPVKIEDKTYKVYVAKRPHVDDFMKRCGELYEVVIFTASLAQYADPVVDLLDIHKVVDWRLFRESCTPYKGAYVKDMGRMGRDINQIMIVDNSPHSYLFNRENAIPCESWYNDANDRELLDMIPVLEKLAASDVTDVRVTLRDMQISPLMEMENGLGSTDSEGSDYDSDDVTDEEGSDDTGTGSSEYTSEPQE